MNDDLVVPVDKLVGSVGRQRTFQGQRPINLRFGDTTVDGPMLVAGKAVGTNDGVNTKFDVSAEASFVCRRCLFEWTAPVSASGTQYFRIEPDEDGYMIVDASVDVGQPAQDELALSLPAVPVCKPDCAGLCPTCGTDLNREPCGGHSEDPDSPFAVLKDLFDS